MKIIGLKTKSGSNLHRVQLPLSFLKADFVDSLQEEVLKNYDVVYLHYSAQIIPAQLGYWKSKYGFKLILDLDDSWTISKNHPSYKSLIPVIQRSKELVTMADHVIVTCDLIKEEIKDYNDSVHVVPNGIPWNNFQYQVWNESLDSFMNRKIRIGIVGSASHYEDWLSIKGQIKRMLTDGEIKNCEFVVGGYTDANSRSKQIWGEIASMFKNPTIIRAKDIYNYIESYREVDILLCPLVDNAQNRSRSNLKVLEAACTNTIPVLGELYREKSPLNNVHLFEDWYKNVKTLISDKEELYYRKIEVSKYIRDNHIYYSECVEPRIEILKLPKKEIDLDIWGITYADAQHTEYKEYRNHINSVEQKSYLFEYNVIKELCKNM